MVVVPTGIDVAEAATADSVRRIATHAAAHLANGPPVDSWRMVGVEVAGGHGTAGAVDERSGTAVPANQATAVAAGEFTDQVSDVTHVSTLARECVRHRRVGTDQLQRRCEQPDAGLGAVPG